ncbi:hypothetical protein [Luedemannella helvata]|uniref:hypothetical protein n=1 Tax=Luedemannella helvata TaxID=349315 RepID=UPI0031D995E2
MAPIAYAIHGEQHYEDLKSYKAYRPASLATGRLAAIGELFLLQHRACLERAAGRRLAHASFVPSTSARVGRHPLGALLDIDADPGYVALRPDRTYPVGQRQFARDWFRADAPARGWIGGVVLLDDTWTTGSRVQSAAYALKAAGAPAVVAVVLGRFVRADRPAAASLIDRARARPFDTTRCVICEA